MDKNTVTGLILIFIVMIAWGYFSMPSKKEIARRKAKQAQQDSITALKSDSATGAKKGQMANAPRQGANSRQRTAASQSNGASTQQENLQQGKQTPVPTGSLFAQSSVSDTSTVIIKTPLYRTTFTNIGAAPVSFTLLKFDTWNGKPVQLIADTSQAAYSLGFLTSKNYSIETRQLLFRQVTQKNSIKLKKGETAQLKYVLPVTDGKKIVYTYTFYGDSYKIGLDVSFKGLRRTVIGSTISFSWKSELPFTERSVQRDANTVSAYVYSGGELRRLRLTEAGRKMKEYDGDIKWVASRTQFFAQIIKSQSPTRGAVLIGKRTDAGELSAESFHYTTTLQVRKPESGVIEFGLYMGPLSAHTLDGFASTAYSMVDVGYAITSWFSEPLVRWIILPFFDLVGNYMNMGLAIILFAILVKLVLYPLTKKQFKSMAAMKELQPEMQKIKEKYGDDPKKQQQETMKLYKEAGANPIAGCLPMLLQLPILITLWRFFQNSILIRGESFLWANDLSAPDYIINLPFEIPFIGDQLAGFVLLMCIAMVFQSRLTGGMSGGAGGGMAGPMKNVMQFVFPVIMLFIFNNFAAGLSLYYLIYNVMSIAQQLIINKQMEESQEVEKAIA